MLVVATLFSDVSQYLFARKDFVAPLYWIVVFGFLVIPLVLDRLHHLNPPVPRLLGFALGYLLLVGFAWMNSDFGPNARQVTSNAVLSVMLLVIFAFIFNQPLSLRAGRLTLLVVVAISVLLNIYEFFIPGAFGDSLGRSAGLYMNPNTAAIALVLGAVISLPEVPVKWRELAMFAVGAAVFLTLSRGGILCWLIAFAMTAVLLRFSARRCLLALAVAALMALVTTRLFDSPLMMFLESDGDFVRRLEFFMSGELDDGSSMERKLLMHIGWEKFLQQPLLGWGIGATYDQAGNVLGREAGLHNMYLSLVVEHGILGIAIVPAMSALMIWGTVGVERRIAITLGFVFLVWAFFDHNMLDAPTKLLIFAMQAAAGSSRCGEESFVSYSGGIRQSS